MFEQVPVPGVKKKKKGPQNNFAHGAEAAVPDQGVNMKSLTVVQSTSRSPLNMKGFKQKVAAEGAAAVELDVNPT